MLIRPFEDITTPQCDLKYATITNSHFKLEHLLVEPKKNHLIKTTYVGSLLGSYGTIYDFINTITDLNTSRLIEVNSSITNRELGERVPFNFVPLFDHDNTYININDIIDNYKVKNMPLYSNYDLSPVIDAYEDEMNMNFCESLGMISAFCSGATLLAPFRCAVILDSDLGYKIDKLDVPFPDYDILQSEKCAINNFIRGISILYARFKEVCKYYEEKLRYHIYINEFGTYITVYNEYNKKLILNLNNTDHCRILRYIDACYGAAYTSSEIFGLLLETESVMLIPTLFEGDYVKKEFVTAHYPEIYESIYRSD
jgi:hypothetical protein